MVRRQHCKIVYRATWSRCEWRDDAVFPAVRTRCRIPLVRRSHFGSSSRHDGHEPSEAPNPFQSLVGSLWPCRLCLTRGSHSQGNTALGIAQTEEVQAPLACVPVTVAILNDV